MKKSVILLVFVLLVFFAGSQEAAAVSITATPKTQVFGPNDWIIVNLKVQGFHGGPVSWVAHRPNNSTVSGNLTTVKPDGTVTQEIVRDAFDNFFGNWTITYKYDNANQTAGFKVSPIVLNIFMDKNLYYEPDVMHLNITTSYFNPVANMAAFYRINFLDQKGDVITDIPEIDIRAFERSMLYNFHMPPLADYHPPGLYKLRVQYYSTVTEIPFLVGKFSELMLINSHTDKSSYQTGDTVNIGIAVSRVTQSGGTIKITDPSGNASVRDFSVTAVHTDLSLAGITKVPGTYSYTIQYAGVTQSGSFNVIPNPKTLPSIQFQIFPDKLNYRPGEIMHLKAAVSQVIAGSMSVWAVDPNDVEHSHVSIPVSAKSTILPNKIAENAPSGQWKIFVSFGGLVQSAPFVVVGGPVDENELLDAGQFAMPSFVSDFAPGTSFSSPSGIAIDPDGNVYVVDAGNSMVEKFDPAGKLLLSWGSEGTGNGQFVHPSGITVTKKYVFVADTGNARIQMFDNQGKFLYQWGGYGNEEGQFHTPAGVAHDSFGNLLVADSDRNKIQIFNSQDVYTGAIRPVLTPGGNFTALNGISVDSRDDFYLSSPDNRILKFSDAGDFMNFFGSGGSEQGRFNNPTAITTDSQDNFYVADTDNHRIQKFDSYGNFLLSWGTEGSQPGQFEQPVGLATDSSGNIYVVDKKNNSVEKFSLSGTGGYTLPSWARERTMWWSEGAVGDGEFLLAVKYMIAQNMINANFTKGPPLPASVPNWLKNDASWWSQGQIDDKTFAENLEYLLTLRILRI